MLNADLFSELNIGEERPLLAAATDAAGARVADRFEARRRLPRSLASVDGGAGAGHHFRIAMKVARRMGRIEQRDRAGRLICHHLRCMLDEPAIRAVRTS